MDRLTDTEVERFFADMRDNEGPTFLDEKEQLLLVTMRMRVSFRFFFRSPENQTQGIGSGQFVFHQIQVTDHRTILWKTAGGTVDLKPDHPQRNERGENNPESDDLLRVTSDPFF